jgi:hypothetical protein
MPMVSHPCKTCPAVLTYEQRTKRRVYCAPCKRAADKASNIVSQALRRQRYGRLSIRTWRQLEQEERA